MDPPIVFIDKLSPLRAHIRWISDDTEQATKYVILVNDSEWAEVSINTNTYIITGLTPNQNYTFVVREFFQSGTNVQYIDSIGIYKSVKTVYSSGITPEVSTIDPEAMTDPEAMAFSALNVLGIPNAVDNTLYSFVEATKYGTDIDEIYMHHGVINLYSNQLVLVKKVDGTFHTIGGNTIFNLRGLESFNHLDPFVSNLDEELSPHYVLNTFLSRKQSNIKKIALTEGTGVVLLENGEVWTWGGGLPFKTVTGDEDYLSMVEVTSNFHTINDGESDQDLKNNGWSIKNIIGLAYQYIVHLQDEHGHDKLCLIGLDYKGGNFSGYFDGTTQESYHYFALLKENSSIQILLNISNILNNRLQDLQGYYDSFRFKVNEKWYGYALHFNPTEYISQIDGETDVESFINPFTGEFYVDYDDIDTSSTWMGEVFAQPLTELTVLNDFLAANTEAVSVKSTSEKTVFYVNKDLYVTAKYASSGGYGTQNDDGLNTFTKVTGMTLGLGGEPGSDLRNVEWGDIANVELLINNLYGLLITTSDVLTASITTPVAPNNNMYVMFSENSRCKLRLK
jgi:hypothetical protein